MLKLPYHRACMNLAALLPLLLGAFSHTSLLPSMKNEAKVPKLDHKLRRKDRGNVTNLANETDVNGTKAEKCWSCKIKVAYRGTVSADGLWVRRICFKCGKVLETRPLHGRCKRRESALPFSQSQQAASQHAALPFQRSFRYSCKQSRSTSQAGASR